MNDGSRGWRIATPIAALMAIVVMAMPPTTAGASPADNATSKELVIIAEQVAVTSNVTVRQHDALADLMKDSAWEMVVTVSRATRTAKGFTMVLTRKVAYRLDDGGTRVDSLVFYDTATSRSTPQVADRRMDLDDDVGWRCATESVTTAAQVNNSPPQLPTRNNGDTARSTTTMQAGEVSRLILQSGGWRSAAPQFTVRLLVNRDPYRPVAVVNRRA